MPTIELYDYEAAGCPTKVRWVLAETGLPWHRRRIDLAEFEQKSARYLRVHPHGFLPAALIDGGIVLEASTIMTRIAEAAGSTELIGDSPSVRERIDRVLELVAEMHQNFGPLLYSEIFLPLWRRRTPERRDEALANMADPEHRRRVAYLINAGIEQSLLDAALQRVESAFTRANDILAKSPWLAGAEFTIADIDLFPYVNAPIQLTSDLWFERLPHLTHWLARMRQRPAYVEALINFPYDDEVWSAVCAAPHGGGFRPAAVPSLAAA